jgi:hypothetical protein
MRIWKWKLHQVQISPPEILVKFLYHTQRCFIYWLERRLPTQCLEEEIPFAVSTLFCGASLPIVLRWRKVDDPPTLSSEKGMKLGQNI